MIISEDDELFLNDDNLDNVNIGAEPILDLCCCPPDWEEDMWGKDVEDGCCPPDECANPDPGETGVDALMGRRNKIDLNEREYNRFIDKVMNVNKKK